MATAKFKILNQLANSKVSTADAANKVKNLADVKLLNYVSSCLSTSQLATRRSRMEVVAKMLARKSDAPKHVVGCEDVAYSKPEEEISLPITRSLVDTMHAQLVEIFLANNPPIKMFSAPTGDAIAAQYNNLFAEHSSRFKWRRNLLRVLLDAVHYNVGAAHICYVEQKSVIPRAQGLASDVGQVDTVLYAGEKIEHLNAYDIFWDEKVPVCDVHEKGAYVGYVQNISDIALHNLCANLNVLFPKRKLSTDLQNVIIPQENVNVPQITIKSYRPEISPFTPTKLDAVNALLSDIGVNTNLSIRGINTRSLITVYVRVIPGDFGYAGYADAQHILKLLIVDGTTLISVTTVSAMHGYFPIVITSFREDSTDNLETFTEELNPLQNVASKLYNMEILSARRNISDRAIYDPKLVDEKHVNSSAVNAKIPLSPRAVPGDINAAYRPIPYEDRAMGTRISTANALIPVGNSIAGLNQAAQGQFVKGNKSPSEFAETMQNMGARMRTLAINLDDTFFSVLREILKSDVLQYQQAVKVRDMRTGQQVSIDPAILRDNSLNFEIAAGLTTVKDGAGLDALQVGMQMFMANPQLAGNFKSAEAVAYMLRMMGFNDIDMFLKTEQEKQAEQQAALQQQAQQLQLAQQLQQQQTPQQTSQPAR